MRWSTFTPALLVAASHLFTQVAAEEPETCITCYTSYGPTSVENPTSITTTFTSTHTVSIRTTVKPTVTVTPTPTTVPATATTSVTSTIDLPTSTETFTSTVVTIDYLTTLTTTSTATITTTVSTTLTSSSVTTVSPSGFEPVISTLPSAVPAPAAPPSRRDSKRRRSDDTAQADSAPAYKYVQDVFCREIIEVDATVFVTYTNSRTTKTTTLPRSTVTQTVTTQTFTTTVTAPEPSTTVFVTNTISTTELITQTISTTVTATYTQVPPVSTIYAPCTDPQNYANGINANGTAIPIVAYQPLTSPANSFLVITQVAASSAQDCCITCFESPSCAVGGYSPSFVGQECLLQGYPQASCSVAGQWTEEAIYSTKGTGSAPGLPFTTFNGSYTVFNGVCGDFTASVEAKGG